MDQDATWYSGMPRPKPHCVGWGPIPPLQKGHSGPHFSADVYCGQMAGCIRIPLRTAVGLGPGDIVLDGNPAPPPTERGTASPHFLADVYCGQTVAHLSNC